MSRTEEIRAAMKEAEASLPLERVPCPWGNVRYLLARVERMEAALLQVNSEWNEVDNWSGDEWTGPDMSEIAVNALEESDGE